MELIKHYMQEGNRNHATSLARTLMEEDTEESRALLENSILTSTSPENLSEVVKSYVKKRRAKAKDFITKYEQVLLNTLGELIEQDHDRGGAQIQRAGGTRKYIAKLMRYTEALKPAQLLTKLTKKDTNIDELMELLRAAYKDQDVTKDINKFIYAAAKAEEPAKAGEPSRRMRILWGLYHIMYPELQSEEPQPVPNIKGVKTANSEPRKISFSKYEKEYWETLLDDKDSNGGTMVGMILDKYVHPDRQQAEYQPIRRLGTTISNEIMTARSKAILEGKQPESLPNPDKVPAARKAELIKSFQAVEPVKLREAYLAHSHVDKTVLIQNGKTREKFAEAKDYILAFSPNKKDLKEGRDEQIRKAMLPIIGKKYESATAIEIMKILKSNEVIFNGGAWYLGSSEALPGRVLSYHAQHSLLSIDEVQEAWDEVEAGKREAFIVVAAYEYGTPISHTIIDDKNPAKKEKLTEIFNNDEGVFIAMVTKASIEQAKKAAGGEKSKTEIIDALLKKQPAFKKMRKHLEKMEMKELKKMVKQFEGVNDVIIEGP